MTRTVAIKHIKVALSKGDITKATRLYIENRISRATYNKIYKESYRAS